MLATSLFYTPTFRFYPCLTSPVKSRNLSTSNPVFVCEFITGRRGGCFVNFGGFGPKTMTEMSRISAFRSSDDSEEGSFMETEPIVRNGSLDFRRDFEPGGLESTLNRLSKWLVAALFGAVILWKHDSEALWTAMGSVINACLSNILKQILNQERPVSTLRSDPGMPSSHAQSIFFAVVFSVLSLVEWLGMTPLTVTVGAIALICGSYLSWLRVSQLLHTVSQVVVGAVLGSIFSIMWFWLWHAFVWKAFISSLLVRIVVVSGSVAFCLAFLLYVIRYWLVNEDETI
ncbi:phosphatidic acid phosphatase (PAP2) family protein [Tasmannia lanceolata]|uniref:phosphatidic acid phosphatase (PAP2) family protein n=1 Tax=Tasmannia lanceolata TaxID=3420 RepID=UPI004064B31E